MPYVHVADARKLIPEVSLDDGAVGFLVRKHWTAWLPYLLIAPPFVAAVVGATGYLLIAGYLVVTSWWFLLWLAASVYVTVKVTLIWKKHLTHTVVLVTPKAIYSQRVQKLFFTTVLRVNTSEIGPMETRAESWLFPGKRTLIIRTHGDMPDVTFLHAGEGEKMEQGVSHVLSTTSL
jgi:hypothetical protein